MSTDLDIFSNRLRDEFARLELSLAEIARRIGEKDSGRLKQIVSGRQRCPIELLSALGGLGVNVYYVLNGRAETATVLTASESALINNYRLAPESGKRALETTSAALAGGSPPPTGEKKTRIRVGTNHGQVIEGGVINQGPMTIGNVIKKK